MYRVTSASMAAILVINMDLAPSRWLHNALDHGWSEITLAFGLGALLYQILQPYIPDFSNHSHDLANTSGDWDKVRWFTLNCLRL
jgi:hypothetical protein